MADRTDRQEAAAADTSVQRLRELATTSSELARIVAQNHRVIPSIELLQTLAQSEDLETRAALFSNPHLSIELLQQLNARFPDRRLEYPDLNELLAANPDLAEIPPLVLIALLTLTDEIPAHYLEIALASTDENVLLAIANHSGTDRQILTQLIAKDVEAVTRAAKLHVNWADELDRDRAEITQAELLLHDLPVNCFDALVLTILGVMPAKLYSTLPAEVRNGLFSSSYAKPIVSIEMLVELADDGQEWAIDRLAEHPHLTVEIAESLIERRAGDLFNREIFYLALVQRLDISQDWLRQLVRDPEYGYCNLEIASNEITPPDVLALLAADDDRDVRLAVAEHERTLAPTLAILATDADPKIRSAVAKHPHTSPETLAELAIDLDLDVRYHVGSNSHTPVRSILNLATDPDAEVRCSIAANIHTPVDLLWQLAHHQDEYVRERVAENINAPIDLLEQLATDNSIWTRHHVASNPAAPVALLKQLAKDEDKHVRHGVVSNPNTPTKLLAKLVKDPAQRVRSGIAEHPNTSLATLIKLFKLVDWPYYNVTRTAIHSPKIPVAMLTELARKKNTNYREFVADCPHAPRELLVELSHDRSAAVRADVARNPHTPPEILIRLATQDEDEYVRSTAMLFNPSTPKDDRLAALEIPRIVSAATPSLCRLLALSHPAVPIADLERLSRSILWLERYAISKHPNTPIAIVRQLALDANRVVRATARDRLEVDDRTV